jgi:putative sigma-54 modulation protein
MKVSITFRHLEPTDALKEYVNEKVGRVQRFLPGPADASVVLSTERHLQGCDVTITGSGKTFNSSESSDDMYASVDRAVDRIERQVRRAKSTR